MNNEKSILNLLKDYPYLREVKSPLTDNQLRPLDKRCEFVQFSSPLTDEDYSILAKFISDYPDICLRAYGHYGLVTPDLSFLKYFPGIHKFAVDIFELLSIKGIEHISNKINSFSFGSTRKKISLQFLSDSLDLQSLYIEGHDKNIEVLRKLIKLEKLELRSVTLNDLEIIKDTDTLWWFALKLGGTKNLDVLTQKPNIKYLEVLRVMGLSDLNFISEMTGLQYLFLQDMPRITKLPDLTKLINLRRIQIESLKGLKNIESIATAKNMEELILAQMSHLQIDDFYPLLHHPSLKKIFVGVNNTKKRQEVLNFLGYEPMKYSKGDFLFS